MTNCLNERNVSEKLIQECLDHFTETHRVTADMVSTFMDLLVCSKHLQGQVARDDFFGRVVEWILEKNPRDIDLIQKHHIALLGFYTLVSFALPDLNGIADSFEKSRARGAILDFDSMPERSLVLKRGEFFEHFWSDFLLMSDPSHLNYEVADRAFLLEKLELIKNDKDSVMDLFATYFSRTIQEEDPEYDQFDEDW